MRRALAVFLTLAGVLAALSVSVTRGTDGWLVGLTGVEDGWISENMLMSIHGDFVLALGRASLPVMLAAALVWTLGRRGSTWTAVILAGLVTLDLGLATRRFAPTVPGSFYTDVPSAARVLRDQPGVGRVWVEDPWAASVRPVPRPTRFVERSRWQRQALMGYVGASYGLDLAFQNDTEQFATLNYTRLRLMVESAPAREKMMLLGAAGATHVLGYTFGEEPYLERLAVFRQHADPPQVVWQNRLAVPRARLVETLLPYEGDNGFIEAVSNHPDDLFQRAALVEIGELREHGISLESLPALVWESAPTSPGEVELVEDRGSMLRLGTRGAAGFLVVSDVLSPGWTVTVDGTEAPLLRADYAFRAVPLAAGEHQVLMRYRIR